MQKITPHLWYDKEAKEAAEFYASVFPNSRVTSVSTLHDTPSGDADVVSMEIGGHEFMAISAGPLFKFTPAVSFMFRCESPEQVDKIWNALLPGGQVLMDLGKYPFSERYGWIQDKYGLSWQISYGLPGQPAGQTVTPTLMFVKEQAGKAEEAVNFYASVFKDAKVGDMMRYAEGEGPDKPGTVKYVGFTLEGQEFAAMDSAQDHKFGFNEAISLLVKCETQEEIDYYWGKLSAVPEAEQCGWLKDKYGFSWQIAPRAMDEMMADPDKEKVARVTQAFLQMKKFDLAKLQAAADGK